MKEGGDVIITCINIKIKSETSIRTDELDAQVH